MLYEMDFITFFNGQVLHDVPRQGDAKAVAYGPEPGFCVSHCGSLTVRLTIPVKGYNKSYNTSTSHRVTAAIPRDWGLA
jgi:hypothetical protein